MAGRILPAISGPAGRNTERTSRTGTVLSSNWRASWRTAASTMRTPWGTAGVPLAASRAASFDAWGAFFETRGL